MKRALEVAQTVLAVAVILLAAAVLFGALFIAAKVQGG